MTDPAHSRPKSAPTPKPGAVPEAEANAPAVPSVVLWEVLAAGNRQVLIRFKDQTYQLRQTRNGKLILTK